MSYISIETIPHHEQRYDTVGDWYFDPDTHNLIIRVSKMDHIAYGWKYEILVAIHELVEATLCTSGNITQEMVDKFDRNYKGDGEPGDSPNAPYSGPHCLATGVERILAAVMGVSWQKYEEALDNLPKWKESNEKSNSQLQQG